MEKAQDDVVIVKKKYDAVVSSLSDLMDKKDALKKEQLITTIMKSYKTYEGFAVRVGKFQEVNTTISKPFRVKFLILFPGSSEISIS